MFIEPSHNLATQTNFHDTKIMALKDVFVNYTLVTCRLGRVSTEYVWFGFTCRIFQQFNLSDTVSACVYDFKN